MSAGSATGATPLPSEALLASLQGAFNATATLVEAPVDGEGGHEEAAGPGEGGEVAGEGQGEGPGGGPGGDRRYGSACLDCAPGYWSGQATSPEATGPPSCTPCARGTYKVHPGPERCVLCPNGTFSTVTNATSLGSCEVIMSRRPCTLHPQP
jgi:hypothetical protein